MLAFAGKNRVAPGAIFLSLAFCHVTTMAAIALDAASSSSSGKAPYSTGSGSSGAEDLCGTVPRTGCPADRMVLPPSGMSRLLEKRSAGEPDVVGVSSSADDSGEEEEAEDTSGGSPANRPSGTTGNRKLWNVPFRIPYGGDEEKRKFMFGKRRRDFSAPEQDKIRKRSGGKEKNARKFKFGKRPTEVEETGTGSELDDSPETGYDGRLDAAAVMTSTGSQAPDLDRSEGSSSGGRSKRKFKFGKKSDEENSFQEEEEEEEEEENEEEEMEEEKRKIMFGKRQDYTGYGTLVDDDGESVESKRRAKFQFGKRRNHHVYPYEIFPKLKTKFKLGK